MAPHEDIEDMNAENEGDAEPKGVGGTIFLGDPTTVDDPVDAENHFGTGTVTGVDTDGNPVESPDFCVHTDPEVREVLDRVLESGGVNDGARTKVGYNPKYAAGWEGIFGNKQRPHEDN